MELIPAGSRPYIGGSTTNSALELLLGYDGLGRIFGAQGPGGGRGGPGGGFGGDPGLLRMFNAAVGRRGQLAAARCRGGPARRARRAAPGAPHRPAARRLPPVGDVGRRPRARVLADERDRAPVLRGRARARRRGAVRGGRRRAVAAPRAGPVGRPPPGGDARPHRMVGSRVLDRMPAFAPGVGIGALFVAVAAALVVAVPPVEGDRRAARIATGALVVGLAAVLVGPALFTGVTMTKAIAGGDPAAGPEDGAFGGFGAGRFPGDAGGHERRADRAPPREPCRRDVARRGHLGQPGRAAPAPDRASRSWRWAASSGSDPAPTTKQLQAYVRDGRLRFVLLGGPGGGGGLLRRRRRAATGRLGHGELQPGDRRRLERLAVRLRRRRGLTRGPSALRALSSIAATVAPWQPFLPHVPRTLPLPRRWGVRPVDVVALLVGNGVLIVAMWVRHGGLEQLGTPGGILTGLGQLTALLGTYLALIQLVLMGRSPWLDEAFGMDRLALGAPLARLRDRLAHRRPRDPHDRRATRSPTAPP